jgi:copper homeostasis protein (lipoprotein)
VSEPGVVGAAARTPDLPASYAGTLPCADCAGVRAQLDLWPDGVFHLQRIHVGKPGRDDDRGRWQRAPGRDEIQLHGGREMPVSLAWRGSDALVPLDLQGRPAGDEAAVLRRLGSFTPADLQLSLHGDFRYLDDAASFEECLTGRLYPVAMEGDFAALERAYRESPAGVTGQPVVASFDGEIAARPAVRGGPATPAVVVRRFVGLWPGQSCERAMSRASLAETYWRIVRLRAEVPVTAPQRREAHLILHARENRYQGHFDCYAFAGHYRVEGDRIEFDPPVLTSSGTCMTADPAAISPPGVQLRETLQAAQRWAVNAQVLELFDGAGTSLALLEAVYLR